MMERTRSGHAPGRHFGAGDRIQYRLLVAVSFLLCLVVALAGRVFGAGRGRVTGQSVFQEAKSAAYAAAGYAFMA